jgi:hypothetical protein
LVITYIQAEVVEQPFPGRRNPVVCRDCRREHMTGASQDMLILRQPPDVSFVVPVRAQTHPE